MPNHRLRFNPRDLCSNEVGDTTDTNTSRRHQCRHIFTDGHRCGSPCLRNSADGAPEPFCYYHGAHRHHALPPRKARSRRNFLLPVPEDRSAIQLAIGLVLERLASQDIDPRRAGLLLYGLQIASINLPREPRPGPDTEPIPTIEEVSLDPTLGPLAPPAPYVAPSQRHCRPSSTALMLEEIRHMQSSYGPPTVATNVTADSTESHTGSTLRSVPASASPTDLPGPTPGNPPSHPPAGPNSLPVLSS